MANFVIFQMYEGSPVKIIRDDPHITYDLTKTTVKNITVVGEPWILFDSFNYGGDFRILRAGKDQPFPSTLSGGIVQSVRMINGGIDNSEVTLYAYPFFRGTEETFQSSTPHLKGNYCSLKVTKGAVVFFHGENYTGGKTILLNGDEVQNFNVVTFPSIGNSVKTAGDMGSQ